MQTSPITKEDLKRSVIAVPPLARDDNGTFSLEENRKIVRHIEKGGVTTLLYGGNAIFYHIRPSEYAGILDGLTQIAAHDSLVVPAAGPAFGLLMDQAEVLKNFDFPTVMVLPQEGVSSFAGVENGLRQFAEALGKPIVLYIKYDGYIDVENAKRLVDDGLVSWIKYAVVRENTENDPYLKELTEKIDPDIIVSGIGEQPAIIHLRDFGLAGFTSGCVCVRPDMSDAMLKACQAEDWAKAETIRGQFEGLEDLRNEINPIRVLHEAVELAGLAKTGPIIPYLSGLAAADRERVKEAAVSLLQL